MTDAAAPIDEVEEKEGIDLRPNGSVHLWIDGNRTKLHVVRVRDIRFLRAAFDETLAAINAATADASKWAADLRDRINARIEAGATGDLTDEERAADEAKSAEYQQLIETEMLAWWATMIKRLGDVEMEPEDLPAWMVDTASPSGLFTHWRTVPSLSGAR